MATILKRYSDNGRTVLLSKLSETASNDKAKNLSYISDETLAVIVGFIPKWQEKFIALSNLLSAREKEVREKNLAVIFLEQVLRDVWEVLKRRVRRMNQPVEVLTFYGLPQSGFTPKSLKMKDLLATTAKVIDGDAKAVEAGYPAMQNPDIAELQAALDIANAEIADVAPADRAYDIAEEELEALRTTADELISNAIDELKFYLRKKDPASQRRIIQSYGVEIKYNKNEIEDQIDTPIEDVI